jgi:carbonic anhydrase
VREIVWRHDPAAGYDEEQPGTAAAARARLDAGNAAFSALAAEGGRHVVAVGPEAFGLPRAPGAGLAHEPFAAVLGCSDARVPAELVFGQAANDLFVVRVAGNVPGTECVGSLEYAVEHLATVRLVVVLGHTGCGAVTAAVETFLAPETYLGVAANPELRAIVDALLAAVHMADAALRAAGGDPQRDAAGYRDALVEAAVVANAALTAAVLKRAVAGVEVAFGVFDLARRTVGLPAAAGWAPGLADAPADDAALAALLRAAAFAMSLSG